MNLQQSKLALAALFLGAVLASCSSILPTGEDGKKPPQRFLLSMTQTELTPTINSAIRVEDFDAPAELALDRIVVRRGAQEVLYTKGARWTDKPTRLMRSLVSDYLKANSKSIVASPTQIDVPIVYRLSGRLSAFHVRVDGAPTASVRFEALLNNTRNRAPVARVFAAEAAADSDSPSAMAAALNTASNQVAKDVAAWVADSTS
jgi:cholesterol transport system auxiliary component